MRISVFTIVAGLICSFALTACSSGDSEDSLSSPSSTPATSSSKAETSTTKSETTSSEVASDSVIPSHAAIEPAPITEAAVEQPYVLYCLEGTPGPATWSDNQIRFSQECFDSLTVGQGDYRCPYTDHYVHDPSECESNRSRPSVQDSPAPLGGDPSTWFYDGPRNENGDPVDHPQLNWPS